MAKTPAQALLDEVVAAALTPELREIGYRKAGRTFRRTRERCVQVLNVQASQLGTAHSLTFTINLGVFFPEVHALRKDLEWAPGAAGPTESMCPLRTRIGTLLPSRLDCWWELRETQDVDQVSVEVRAAVETHGLPWLEERSVFETAGAMLTGVDAVAFQFLMGERDVARRSLKTLLRRESNRDVLTDWGMSLGLLP